MLSSCGTLERRAKEAGEAYGKATAGVKLADWPADCRKKEPHAEISPGMEARSVIKRGRSALDRQNARTDRCAQFYDNQKKRMEARQ